MADRRSKLRLVRGEPPSDAVDFPGTTAAQIGMWIFLGSLAVLFIAAITGYLIIRYQTHAWRSSEMPPLPRGLWVSTAIMLGASVALQLAVAAARRSDDRALVRRLVFGLALGLGFVAAQMVNWTALASANLPPDSKSLYAFTFYMLTGIHAAHVVGGLLPLTVCIVRARRGRYSALNNQGVRFTAQYWHFTGGVWLVLLSVLWCVS